MKQRTSSFLSPLTGVVEELRKKWTSEEEPPEGGKGPGSHWNAELLDCLPRPQDTPPRHQCHKHCLSSHPSKSGHIREPIWGGPLPASSKPPLFFSFSYPLELARSTQTKAKTKLKRNNCLGLGIPILLFREQQIGPSGKELNSGQVFHDNHEMKKRTWQLWIHHRGGENVKWKRQRT